MIAFLCPGCRKTTNVPDQQAGRAFICPHCRAGSRVPLPAPVAALARPTAATAVLVEPLSFAAPAQHQRPQKSRRAWPWVAGVLVLSGIFVLIAVLASGSAGSKTIREPPEPVVRMDAHPFFSDYKDNPVVGDEKYRGQWVELDVGGCEIDTDHFDYRIAAADFGGPNVVGYYAAGHKSAFGKPPFNRCIIQGRCRGLYHDASAFAGRVVYLDDCRRVR